MLIDNSQSNFFKIPITVSQAEADVYKQEFPHADLEYDDEHDLEERSWKHL